MSNEFGGGFIQSLRQRRADVLAAMEEVDRRIAEARAKYDAELGLLRKERLRHEGHLQRVDALLKAEEE